MASRVAVKRLTLEFKSLQANPTPYIDARPSEDNILQWYFVITGPPDTPFEGGQYLGSLTFPANYPYAPPSLRMLTPSGRFEPGARICLTMSDFHPETWNPAWNVGTILTGLLSFMCSTDVTSGAMYSTPAQMRAFTKRSVKWNLANDTFTKFFADVVAQIRESVTSVDDVEYIEVVPPKASEIIAHINASYRPHAYETAQHMAKTQRANKPAETPAPGSGGVSTGLWIAVGSVLLVAIVAGLLLRR